MTDRSEFGTVTPDGDRAQITFHRWLPATPEVLWDALTNPDRMTAWFDAEAAVRPGAGGSIELRWDQADQWVRGDILTWDPPRALSYTWHFPGESESVIHFEIEPAADGAVLHLTHRHLGEAGSGYGAAWHAYLDRLAGQLHGTDVDWFTRFQALRPHYTAAP